MDISNIITPVKVDRLERLLRATNYDTAETEYLIEGFTNGFDLGYQGPVDRQDTSTNLPLRIGSKRDIWSKLMTEVKTKRVAGPFKRNDFPFKQFIQSPLGLVPKSGNKTRMIFHLSFDFNGKGSVNGLTPKEICSVKYNDLDHTIGNSLKLLENTGETQKLFYTKTDVSNAFKLVPLKRWSWRWCTMSTTNPETGETVLFFDKTLPFGASISCNIFQWFSNCVKHIAEHYIDGATVALTNYLDDYLVISTTEESCG